MKRIFFSMILILESFVLFAQNAPYVYNVIGTQRIDGSKKVDIYYDVFEPDSDTLLISLQVSSNNGNSFDIVPVDSLLSGDIGEGVQSGNNKHIIWQAGREALNFEGNSFKFKVIADDDPYAAPDGFVIVQGGTFQMGDHFNEGTNNELPLHNVTLNSFYMSENEVTQEEYQAIMGNNPAHNYGVGTDYPVYYVSWYDAISYCNAKSIEDGFTPVYSGSGSNTVCDWNADGYRLPTEAEWEYASRGGSLGNIDNFRYSGCHEESDLTSYAWYISNNSPAGSKEVRTKSPNQLGLYDMSGNEWEWCWDWYGNYNSNSQINPHGANSGSYRVKRGGAWNGYSDHCRVAYRTFNTPTYSNQSIGFRICRNYPH